jgi:hypothetical protein
VARTADRSVTLVLDPDDDVDDLARLRRLHARPLGQVVCEPAPGGGTAGLARSLLAALGKELEPGPPRDPLWQLVDLHLQAERVHDLILLRAHTLAYPALRHLADHTQDAGAHLWLVVHQERAPAPVAQLLEGVPHDTATLPTLLGHAPDSREPVVEDDVPIGAGRQFPYLDALDFTFEPAPRRARTAIARELSRGDRARVRDAWDEAHAWTAVWLEQRPDATYPEAADAVYTLARHGDTQSEIYLRIRAALEAFDRAGVDTDLDAVDHTLTNTFGETRPCQFNHAVSRAAALADHSADPELAALIALAAVVRDLYFIQQANLVDLADSGSIIAGPWGGTTAIPPELRRFLATLKRKLGHERPHPAVPLFPGNSHGRRGGPAIRRTLQALDAPASLWEDPPDTDLGTGDSADGRALLRRLTAWNLRLQRRHEGKDRAGAGH